LKKSIFFDYRIWASHAVAISLCRGQLGLCNVPRSTAHAVLCSPPPQLSSEHKRVSR